jgi:putative hydrolase of the HAD superfamily
MRIKVKAICFDADGVVVNPQKQFSIFREKQYGMTPEITALFFDGIFNDCLTGKSDLAEILPPFFADWGWKGSVEEFIRVWHEKEHVVDSQLIEVVQRLRQSGFVCCLATNQEKYRTEYMKKQMGFQSLFDHLFFSCEMGCMKPDQDYYRAIEKTLRIKGEEILFWDDAPKHVQSARECGWLAEIYTGFESFKGKLAGYTGAIDL